MALSTQPYKGARDFYPEDKRLQKYIFNVWRKVAERYGYEEYDAPIIEPLELYKAKTGDEIVSEQTYNFTDRGGRGVTLRPEMTPTVSRMVAAKRQELGYPLRWYSIPNVWRYERPQKGRLREHWQLNVDLFGVEGLAGEHEMIEIANELMKTFGASPEQYTIRINSRKLADEALSEFVGANKEQTQQLVRLIDKMHKIDTHEFEKGLHEILSKDADKLSALLKVEKLSDLPGKLQTHVSVKELEILLGLLKDSGTTNAVFDISLMRGFDYYTDIVFEVYDNHPENNRSMFGGGRYDGLVALFGVEKLPTIGFGMGDVTLQNFIEGHKLLPDLKAETNLYVVLIGDVYEESSAVIKQLREAGINVAVDTSGAKAEKQLKSAVKKGIPYALFIGDKELKAGKYNLKNLETQKEEQLNLDEIIIQLTRVRDV